jgi:hypothetical protein
METILAPIIRALKEGPIGGLALGIAASGWLIRALLREKDAHRESWKQIGVLADTYARLIASMNEKKAVREIRLAQKEEAIARRAARTQEVTGRDTDGGAGNEESG